MADVELCFLCKKEPKANGKKICEICYEGILEHDHCECGSDAVPFMLKENVKWCDNCDREIVA